MTNTFLRIAGLCSHASIWIVFVKEPVDVPFFFRLCCMFFKKLHYVLCVYSALSNVNRWKNARACQLNRLINGCRSSCRRSESFMEQVGVLVMP
jgi:hypothetical protein